MIKVSKESAVLGGLLSSQVFVKFEQPIESEFNVTGKLLGPKGQFLRQVAVDSGGAKVHLRGKDTLPGADDPLHIYISANSQGVLDKAIKLANDLVSSVHKQYEEFRIKKATPVPYPPYPYPYPPYMPYGYPPPRGPYRPPYGYYPPARPPVSTGPPGSTPEYPPTPAMPPYPLYPYPPYPPTTETTTSPSATTSASEDPSAAYSQYYAQYQSDPNYDYSAYYGAYSETSAQTATETTTETTNTHSTTPTSNHKRSYQDYVNGDGASNGTKSLNNG
uniref:KHDC4/BBP-like KH-domain type I domain-containing protein n=1 Tax=Arcella intermedia TaxID=1963864 RepID=A0A6B2L8M6_9EUKA